jgi:GDP-mannose 6-dehydrogenase
MSSDEQGKMRISVFGLGYVGAVSAACLVRDGHDVIGVDIDERKLDLLRSGKAPIVEDQIQDLTKDAISSGRLTVSNDANTAIQNSDISFICVGTPSLPNGDQDQTAILEVARQIGTALANTSNYHCVVIRSTVEPGTVNSKIRGILESASGKTADDDFGICFQPEFLREGSSIIDYDNPPFTVIGTASTRSAEMLRSVFEHLPCEFIVTDVGSAECLKYACNAFHALKITFANEIGRVTSAFDIDSRVVMDLVCRDTRLNISTVYLRPGFAFGGSCLPKDLRALSYMAKSRDVSLPMLNSILDSNQDHLKHAIDIIMNSGARKIAMVGLSFKIGTDDLRESPLVSMAEHFIGKGLTLRIYDPQVNLSMLLGANKAYIDKHIPHIGALLSDDLQATINDSDAIIIGANYPSVADEIFKIRRSDQLILDLVGEVESSNVETNYQGICW